MFLTHDFECRNQTHLGYYFLHVFPLLISSTQFITAAFAHCSAIKIGIIACPS
jgi:hypothetical protein